MACVHIGLSLPDYKALAWLEESAFALLNSDVVLEPMNSVRFIPRYSRQFMDVLTQDTVKRPQIVGLRLIERLNQEHSR